MSKNKIGKIEGNNKVTYPDVDIMGKPYTKPVSMRMCTNNQFVIVGNYPKDIVDAEIKKLGIDRKVPSATKKAKLNEKK